MNETLIRNNKLFVVIHTDNLQVTIFEKFSDIQAYIRETIRPIVIRECEVIR